MTTRLGPEITVQRGMMPIRHGRDQENRFGGDCEFLLGVCIKVEEPVPIPRDVKQPVAYTTSEF